MAITAPSHRDNLLGVCHALGEEFGFDPLWLRVALAASLLWNPLVILSGYLLAGVAVWLVRRIIRDRPLELPEAAGRPAANEDDVFALRRAA